MKKVYLKPLLGWLGVGIVSYFTFWVFAQQVDVQTTFSQAAWFVAKLIISSESNQNGVKYIGVNENDNGNVEVYTGYTQIQKVGVWDAFVQQLGIRGGTFLRYGANHASSADEEIFLKYDALEPGIKWIWANYDNALVSINLGKDVNLDDVLVVKNSKVGVNNVDPQVALDIKGALKIGRLGSYNWNFYVGWDNLVYLDGNPIVPFYCGNSYVDSNYVNPIWAPDNVDLEECDNWPANGDGCNNQCQLETPSVTVSASPSYSNNGSLTTTISASTNSWSKLTRINYGNGTASLDPPERTSFQVTRTYSTSSPDASWTITVYARNNLREVRNDIGDNDTDRPTASASTTVRVCNPNACAGEAYIARDEGTDTTCRDYGVKHLFHCENWSCVEYDTQTVWRAQNEWVACGGYCGGTTYYYKTCQSWNCSVSSTTSYPCDWCQEKEAYDCNCRTETYDCNCRTETYDCNCDWVEACDDEGYCDIFRVCDTCSRTVCDTCSRTICDTCYRCP